MQKFQSKLPWPFFDTIIINSKEIPVTIHCQWNYCDTEIEGDEEYKDQFQKGIYSNCYVIVTASTISFHNSDRLYGIHCRTNSIETDLIQTIIDHNMINNAKTKLIDMILSTIQSFRYYELI